MGGPGGGGFPGGYGGGSGNPGMMGGNPGMMGGNPGMMGGGGYGGGYGGDHEGLVGIRSADMFACDKGSRLRDFHDVKSQCLLYDTARNLICCFFLVEYRAVARPLTGNTSAGLVVMVYLGMVRRTGHTWAVWRSTTSSSPCLGARCAVGRHAGGACAN